MKIALTGTHSTGKTTLLWGLAEAMPEYVVISEQLRVAAKYLGLEKISDAPKKAGMFSMLQWEGLRRQVNAEESAGENFITDRAVLDYEIYYRYGIGNKDCPTIRAAYTNLVWNRLKEYDLIIYVPPNIPLVDDGVRHAEEGEPFRMEIDRLIQDKIFWGWACCAEVFKLQESDREKRLKECFDKILERRLLHGNYKAD